MTTKSGGKTIDPGHSLLRPPGRATSYDVALAAGVSQSTVSRVFRDGSTVARTTRRKVEAAAAALNYFPNRIARSLIMQRSGMIAVVITDLSSRAYPEVLFYLGEEIQSIDHRMLVFTLPQDDDGQAAIRTLLSYHVDGIISSAVLDEKALTTCRDAGVPVVMFNRKPPALLASGVACDHETGMDLLLRQIRPLVRGPVAFLAGPEGAPVSAARLNGTRVTSAQIGLNIARVVYADYSFDGGRKGAHAFFGDGGSSPDLIVCANDAMALGVMDACRFELGLRVPEDVMVTGFDDIPQAAWPSYSLTSLRQPVRRMAASAVRLLSERIDSSAVIGEVRLLPAELKLRHSTARQS